MKKSRADHNQSVTDTTIYYGDGFMAKFGGAKQAPNDYNYQYIWPALNAVIKHGVQANQLENNNGFELKDFQVVEEPFVDVWGKLAKIISLWKFTLMTSASRLNIL